jgi:hypothetical protein
MLRVIGKVFEITFTAVRAEPDRSLKKAFHTLIA